MKSHQPKEAARVQGGHEPKEAGPLGEVVAALAVGHPGAEGMREGELAPRQRKPLVDFVFSEDGGGQRVEEMREALDEFREDIGSKSE